MQNKFQGSMCCCHRVLESDNNHQKMITFMTGYNSIPSFITVK